MSSVDTARKTMKQLVHDHPLVHPGVLAMAIRDYDYAPPPHLRSVYGKVWRGVNPDFTRQPKKLVELKPREHGKSDAGTVDNATWMALHNPRSRTLIMSEGSKLAEDKLSQCRQLIEEHGDRFNRTIADNNNSQLTLQNDANHGEATIEAAGFGSAVTGGHFDLIIFDDLVDWPSQRTEARRDKIENQFQNYLNLGSEGETVFLVLGTRKHPDDLYSRLIENPAWSSNVDKAISDWSIIENGEYDIITMNEDTGEETRYPANKRQEIPGNEVIVDTEPHRQVDVLWPERWPLNKLIVDMLAGFGGDEGNLVWKRENQNDASALQGQILSEDMLAFKSKSDMPDDRKFSWHAGLDPAVEEDPEKAATNDTDYWGFAVVKHDQVEDTSYVVDVERKRGMSMQQGLDWLSRQMNRFPKLTRCTVEDAQAQRWFIQTGKDKGMNLRASKSKGSKEDRIISMAARFESGKVKLQGKEQRWLDNKFINEWCEFPGGDHDDRLDAVEIALRTVGSQTVSRSNHTMADLPT